MSAKHVGLFVLLLVLVGGLAFLGWLATRPEAVTEDTPSPDESGSVADLPPERPGAIAGEVRIYRTGAAAADVTVRAAGQETATDAAGRFLFRVPPGRELTVTVDAPEPYAPVVIRGVVAKPGRTEDLGTLYLERAFTVRGIVVDSKGEPVADAEVKAFRPGERRGGAGFDFLNLFMSLGEVRVPLEEVKTGPDGTFVFATLSPGTYHFEATAGGYAAGTLRNVLVTPESSEQHRIVLTTGLKLTGHVLNASKEPVAGAAVTVIPSSFQQMLEMEYQRVQTVTDEEGRFAFGALTPGQGLLMVTAEGYPRYINGNFMVGRQEEVEVIIGGNAAVKGTVRGPDGKPVEGAEVLVAAGRQVGNLGRTTTDAEGKYKVENLPAGPMQFFMVRAEGYPPYPSGGAFQPRRPEALVLEDGATKTKDVTLVAGATVTGRVTDGSTGRPISGAQVGILSPGAGVGLGSGAQAVSDEDGVYSLAGTPKGRHLLIVKAPGYFQEGMGPEAIGLAFGGAGEHPAMVSVEASQDEVRKDLEVIPAATVTGTVVSPAGDPVRGARVTMARDDRQFGVFMAMMGIGGKPVLTDPEGNFRLTVPAGSGSATLAATAEGFVEGKSDPAAVTSGSVTENVVIRLRAGGTLAGSVFGEDGDPVTGSAVRVVEVAEGVDISNEWSWRWQLRQAKAHLVGEDGAFRVEGIKPGRIIFAAEAPGHQETVLTNLTLSEGQTLGGQVIRLSKGLSIRGVVTDESGAPMVGARVGHSRTDVRRGPAFGGGSVQTDGAGRFEIDRLAAGAYTLTASAEGMARASVQGVAAGTTNVRIVMQAGLAIEGRVVLPDGGAASGLQVWASSQDGGSNGAAQTDAEGHFKIEGLGSGPHTVRVQSRDRKYRQTQLDGVEAGTTGVQIQLELGASISGTVVDHEGKPVTGVGVFARPLEGQGRPQGWGRTNEQGEFTVGGLDEGEYEVQATQWIVDGTNRQMRQGTAKATGGATEVRIQLPREASAMPGGNPR